MVGTPWRPRFRKLEPKEDSLRAPERFPQTSFMGGILRFSFAKSLLNQEIGGILLRPSSLKTSGTSIRTNLAWKEERKVGAAKTTCQISGGAESGVEISDCALVAWEIPRGFQLRALPGLSLPNFRTRTARAQTVLDPKKSDTGPAFGGSDLQNLGVQAADEEDWAMFPSLHERAADLRFPQRKFAGKRPEPKVPQKRPTKPKTRSPDSGKETQDLP